MVFLTLGKGVTGFVITGDRKFVLSSRPRPHLVSRRAVVDADVAIEEVPPPDEVVTAEGGFTCDLEQHSFGSVPAGMHAALESVREPRTNGLASGTATYTLNLAIDSDPSLYAAFSSSASNVTTWITQLVAATSIIYQRDLKTNLVIAYTGINNPAYTVIPGATGTWNNASTTFTTAHALAQLGDVWHLTPPSSIAHSAVVLLSGKSKTSGNAWVQEACSLDFLCASGLCGDPLFDGHYGGAYAYCGGVGKVVENGTIPDPNATSGGVQYELPASNFWSLLEMAHELGHVAGSVHTHCIPIVAAADQALAPGRAYVDQCFSGECYEGPTSVPAEKGTIMSYCHLIAPVGPNNRYTFGQSGEVSHLVTDAMVAFLDGLTPHPSAISAPTSISGSNSGTASIANLGAGFTYAWTVANGAVAAGQGTSSLTFTGSADPIKLSLVVTNAQGCSVSDSVSVGYINSNLPAPTAVMATATSATAVSISWTASAGAASYEVARSGDGMTYTIVGTPAASPYSDTAIANTAYLYKVRAVDGSSNRSASSNIDLATTVIFTDDPLVAGSTIVKAVHLTEDGIWRQLLFIHRPDSQLVTVDQSHARDRAARGSRRRPLGARPLGSFLHRPDAHRHGDVDQSRAPSGTAQWGEVIMTIPAHTHRWEPNPADRRVLTLSYLLIAALLIVTTSVSSAAASETRARASVSPMPSDKTVAPINITFSNASVTASGITPGGTALVFGLSRQQEDGWVDNARIQRVLTDTERTGTVTVNLDHDLVQSAVWVAMDLADGRMEISTPNGSHFRAVTFPGGLEDGTSGKNERLVSGRSFIDVIWVRPGTGAWYYSGGGAILGARSNGGKITVEADQMQPIGESPNPPKRFGPHDILLLFDPRRMEYCSTEVTE